MLPRTRRQLLVPLLQPGYGVEVLPDRRLVVRVVAEVLDVLVGRGVLLLRSRLFNLGVLGHEGARRCCCRSSCPLVLVAGGLDPLLGRRLLWGQRLLGCGLLLVVGDASHAFSVVAVAVVVVLIITNSFSAAAGH